MQMILLLTLHYVYQILISILLSLKGRVCQSYGTLIIAEMYHLKKRKNDKLN